MNLSAKELPNFMRKYYLIAELLIFKHRRQNISDSNTVLLTAVIYAEVTLCCEKWELRTHSTFSRSVVVSVAVNNLGHTSLFFIDLGTKVNGQYYRDVLLHQQLLPAIRDLSGDFFTFQQDNTPAHRMRDCAAVNLWNTRLHRSSSYQPTVLPEPNRLPDVGEASQLDAWRWPTEVTPDRRVGTFPPGVHRWSDQAVASMSSSLHSSTQWHFEHKTLVKLDICTDVHFNNNVYTL